MRKGNSSVCFVHDKFKAGIRHPSRYGPSAVSTPEEFKAGDEHLTVVSMSTVFKAIGERSAEWR